MLTKPYGPEKVKRTRAQKGQVVLVQTACQTGVHGAEDGSKKKIWHGTEAQKGFDSSLIIH
jgi:hypothetical protein